jgi:transcriptional regulator with XRE-family HTH domain
MEGILNRITGLRKAKKISQKEISESLGISQAAYAKFESGNSITVDRLYKIAEFLGVSINEILEIQPTKLKEDLNESLILEIESLKKQIENFKERERFNISIKKAVLMSFYTSLTHISNKIDRYDVPEESEIRHESLYDFTKDFKKNLIELGVFVDADFESFEGKQ